MTVIIDTFLNIPYVLNTDHRHIVNIFLFNSHKNLEKTNKKHRYYSNTINKETET